MSSTNPCTAAEISRSSSILRHFLRFAISSIAFQRLVPVPCTSDSTNRSIIAAAAAETEDRGNNHAVDREGRCSMKRFTDSFTEKDYCGIKELKFMDAVSSDGAVIYTPGKFKVYQVRIMTRTGSFIHSIRVANKAAELVILSGVRLHLFIFNYLIGNL